MTTDPGSKTPVVLCVLSLKFCLENKILSLTGPVGEAKMGLYWSACFLPTRTNRVQIPFISYIYRYLCNNCRKKYNKVKVSVFGPHLCNKQTNKQTELPQFF